MAAGNSPKLKFMGKKHRKIKTDDKIAFFQQLSTLLVAGTPLLRAIRIAGEQSESEKFIVVLGELGNQVAAGTSFNDALAAHPKIFDQQWIEMIKAGERTGKLPETMSQLTEYIENRKALRGKIVSSMMYPAVLLCILIASVFVMLWKVVPTFAEMLQDFGSKLPPITQAVIGFSEFIQANAGPLVFGFVVGGAGLRYYLKTPKGSRQKDRIFIRLPLVARLSVEAAMESFAANLSLLLKSGTPLLEALRIIQEIFQNHGVYQPAFARVTQSVSKGHTLAQALDETGLFTPLAVNMIRVGEESGTLVVVLEQTSKYYRQKVEVLIDRLTGMMEPCIVILMGISVGLILSSIYLPMFQMASGSKG